MKSKRTLTILALLLGLTLATSASDLAIQSFNGTGQLTFNELTTAQTYRVEWAPAPSGPWTNTWQSLAAIAAKGSGIVTCSVPMCYRVVASFDSDYLVVDVSGGTGATKYAVSYLTSVPVGGWTDAHKTTNIVFRRIPATTGYTMGSPVGELGRVIDETQHQVALSQDFYIGVFQVTQRQWELVMGNKPSHFNNAAYYQTRPVERVSYYDIRGSSAGANWPATNTVDASSFMGVLRTKTGKTFDLPTESQWEYACRAGTTTALNSGYDLTNTSQDAHMDAVGRYYCNGGSGNTQNGDTSVGTAKVGSYQANAWGLYDMHGNVWEWCLDWYGDYPGTVTDPKGATSGPDRVFRGGSWYAYADYCRSAIRNSLDPSFPDNAIGFRACFVPPVQ